MAKKKSRRIRKKISRRIRWHFPDGDMVVSVEEYERMLLEQYARMFCSDDPELRQLGREQLAQVAKHSVANRFERLQKSGAGKSGAEARWARKKCVTAVIKSLARLVDGHGDPLLPGELWPELYAALEAAGLKPRAFDTSPSLREQRYEIPGAGPVTYDAFRKRIQRLR